MCTSKTHGKPLDPDSAGSETSSSLLLHFSKEMTHACSWASQLLFWHSFLLNEHLPCYLTEPGQPAALFKKQVPFLFTWRQFPPQPSSGLSHGSCVTVWPQRIRKLRVSSRGHPHYCHVRVPSNTCCPQLQLQQPLTENKGEEFLHIPSLPEVARILAKRKHNP